MRYREITVIGAGLKYIWFKKQKIKYMQSRLIIWYEGFSKHETKGWEHKKIILYGFNKM